MEALSGSIAILDETIASLEAALEASSATSDAARHAAPGPAPSNNESASVKQQAEGAPKPQSDKAGKKEKAGKSAKAPPPPKIDDSAAQFHSCDLRVGRIVSVGHHEEADGLFVLRIDVGGGEVRTVCAGLRKYIPDADMADRSVVLICNLKPRKLRGVDSEAMCLAGSVVSGGEKETVVPLAPPSGAEPGDCVSVDGMEGERNVAAGKYVSSKVWDKVVSRFAVKHGKPCYDGKAMRVESGDLVCDLPDGAEIH